MPGVRAAAACTPYLLLLPGMAWLAVFFVVPILTLVSTSTQTAAPGRRDRRLHADLPVRQLRRRALGVRSPSFGRSFLYAFIATVLALAISYPLAYAIAFKAGRWRNLLLVLVVAPFFASFLLRTIAWKQILADEGFVVVDALQYLHLIGQQTHIINSAPAVVIGITYNFLPFMILPIYASLERVDPRLIEAAGDLYANALTTMRKVTFPLSMPGVVAGTLLTFIPAAGDYVNAALLGNRDTTMVGNVIDSRFLRVVDYPTAAVLSVVADGVDPGARRPLHPPRRHGGAGMSATRSPARHDRAVARRPRLQRWLSAQRASGSTRCSRFAYLFVPVAYTLAFSFNDSGKSNIAWQGLHPRQVEEPVRCARRLQRPGQQPEDRPARDARSPPCSAR